ncbi:MAG: biotin/lipoyl-containing protein, partial [Thermoplasmata archaeon]
MYEFKLPDIGEGVSEGEIVKWDVKENEEVKRDQDLVEIMTDKVTVKIPSPVQGKVSRILHAEGEVVKVGSPLIDIDDGSANQINETEEKSREAAITEKTAQKSGADEESAARVLASPAVRRIAREKSINLQLITGSGDNGRITIDDLNSYSSKTEAQKEIVPKPEIKAVTFQPVDEIVEMHGLRRIIFDKMTKSKQ